MNKMSKLLAGAALSLAAISLLSACQKKEEPGPAETLGKKIDGAVQDAGRKLDEVTGQSKDQAAESGSKLDSALDQAKADAKEAYEKTKEGAKDLAQKTGEKMEEAGKKIQEASKK
ncbi:apolipophorin [Herbaspirillum sp. DW155]|uniref:hypothetical protein n=1 Tax=Herbaspirillum sp. DW155 TaxID=3095609 RepID=UPI0030850062|nr:apolipophorin [Herbaspirillum sp. DW155]